MTADTTPDAACLERTRSAVLNVLIAAGLGIAASGGLLRWRDGWATDRAQGAVGSYLHRALIVLVVLTVVTRRVLTARGRLQDPGSRAPRFVRAHVVPAAMGLTALPLGLAYGWFVRPRLDAVAPFWVAALALGALSFPRASELTGLDDGGPAS